MVILPVDQGFEHGPDRSFSVNPDAYDPHYHYEIAIEAGLSAYAAPLGMLEAGANTFAGLVPTILKMNSSTSLKTAQTEPDQIFTARISDALRLGCSAIGITIYPGSDNLKSMLERTRDLVHEARDVGLPTIVWTYPRGRGLNGASETSLDICAYAVHIAALIGAHVIKCKLPDAQGDQLSSHVAHIKQAAFNGARLVVFSGGSAKAVDKLYEEARAIRGGGGNGSIVGRNTFQRSKSEALHMLSDLIEIYKGTK